MNIWTKIEEDRFPQLMSAEPNKHKELIVYTVLVMPTN